MRRLMFPLCLALASLPASADDARPHYGGELQGFEYPRPLHRFQLQSQGLALSMGYLDVAPSGTGNGRTAVLLHGKNFCAATWASTITALSDAGFRVVVPDQIGFCKSSKPARYQFSFAQLAGNTRVLLDSIGVDSAVVVGHSMGGMLATRLALQYPGLVSHLVMVNPIGLEDWKAEGVPWRDIDDLYRAELGTDFESIKRYQLDVYYNGDWRPEYDRWVEMLAGMYAGPDRERVAWNQALTSDMVFNQPVLYEFPRLTMPVSLFIGRLDRTAIGRDRASPELAARLGDYPALGRRAAQAIPNASLVEFDDLGHSPQVEAPERFNQALIEAVTGDDPP